MKPMIPSRKSANANPKTGLTSAVRLDGTGKAGFAAENPLRILIAEDNCVNRRIFRMFLKQLGYEADCVENGLECYNAALVSHYDLILTDIEMPEMSGLECASELRRAGIKVPIVAVSASTRDDIVEACRAAGLDGYLPKPFPPENLRVILIEVYRRKVGRPVAAHERRMFSSAG
jgi:CheY-like chemotaxis protein